MSSLTFTESKRIVALVCALLLVLTVSGCSGNQYNDTAEERNTGITDNEVLIGSSCALTGHASFLGSLTIHGTMAYLNDVNEKGGIHGRRIRFLVHDDAYEPAHAVYNTQKLINEDKVFALTTYIGTAAAVRVVPMVQQARVPLVGIVTGAIALREPFKRYVINIRASYYEETAEVVQHLVQDLGIRKIAIFYQYDEYGFDGLAGTELALELHGLKAVAKASYIRGTLDVEQAVDSISGSDAQAVIMIGSHAPSAKFIKLVKQRRKDLLFHIASFVCVEELVRMLGPEAEGVIVTQAVPPPSEMSLLPVAQEYNRLLAKYFPGEEPNFLGFEGYINAMVLVEGLKRAGRDLTREKLIDAIDGIRQLPIGKDHAITYGPGDHQGLDHVDFVQVKDGKFVPLTDWEIIKRQLGE